MWLCQKNTVCSVASGVLLFSSICISCTPMYGISKQTQRIAATACSYRLTARANTVSRRTSSHVSRPLLQVWLPTRPLRSLMTEMEEAAQSQQAREDLLEIWGGRGGKKTDPMEEDGNKEAED